MNRLRLTWVVLFCLCLLPLELSEAKAGEDRYRDADLRAIDEGRASRHIAWAQNRIAIFSFEDPEATGLGDELALIMARQILFHTRVQSIGVLNFKEGLAPERAGDLSYFDKVDKLINHEQVAVAVWGRVLPAGEYLLIDTYLQLSEASLDENYRYAVRLPHYLGGRELQARLRPDRLRVQSLKLGKAAIPEIRAAAETLGVLRRQPRHDAPLAAKIPVDKVYSILRYEGDWAHLKIKDGPQGWMPTTGFCRGACAPLLEGARFAGAVLARGRYGSSIDHLSPEAVAVMDQLRTLKSLGSGDRIRPIPEDCPELDAVSPAETPGAAAFANLRALALIGKRLRRFYGDRAAEKISRDSVRELFCHALNAKLEKSDAERACASISQKLGSFPARMLERDIDAFIYGSLEGVFTPQQIEKYKERDIDLTGTLADAVSQKRLERFGLDRKSVRRITECLAKASVEDPTNRDVLENLAVLFEYLGDDRRRQLAAQLAQDLALKE